MVFGSIQTIYGIKLDLVGLLLHVEHIRGCKALVEELTQDLTLNEAELDRDEHQCIIYDLRDAIENANCGFQLFTPPCCAKNHNITFVIGNVVDTVKRLRSSCNKCVRFFCCDTCIGMTVRGYYDINTMFDDFFEVPEKMICMRCLAVNSFDCSESCPHCKFDRIESEGRDSMREISINQDFKFVKGAHHFYQLLDDCTSCT